MRSFHLLTSMTVALLLDILVVIPTPAQGPQQSLNQRPISLDARVTTLVGSISYDVFPQVAYFSKKIDSDPEIGCLVRTSLFRLVRVAKSPLVRQLVWKRMLKEEFYWLSGKERRRIEVIAEEADMPLTATRRGKLQPSDYHQAISSNER